MEDVVVRPAREGDYEQVAALYLIDNLSYVAAYPQWFKEPENGRMLSRSNFYAYMDNEDDNLLVAELDEEIVGFAELEVCEEGGNASRSYKRLDIDVLYVAEAHRRKGIGRKLIKSAEIWGLERGAEEVQLTVYPFRAEAIKFYGALGLMPARNRLYKPLTREDPA